MSRRRSNMLMRKIRNMWDETMMMRMYEDDGQYRSRLGFPRFRRQRAVKRDGTQCSAYYTHLSYQTQILSAIANCQPNMNYQPNIRHSMSALQPLISANLAEPRWPNIHHLECQTAMKPLCRPQKYLHSVYIQFNSIQFIIAARIKCLI